MYSNPRFSKVSEMTLFQRLMAPANAICDRLQIGNENERGMMRMLVNMVICSALAVVVFYLGWALLA